MTKSRFALLTIVTGMLLGLWSATPLRAQSIYGTITGTVSDQSGAVVPGASVLLKNGATQEVRKSETNNEGYFSYSSVPTGTYSLSVKLAGFQTAVTEGIQVTGASVLAFPFKLNVESAATRVEVTTNADQIISTDSGQQEVTLTTKQLQDFTIVGANAAEFIKILPGFAQRNNGDGLKTGTDFNGQVIGINGNGDGGSQSPLNGAFVANGTGTGNIDITADGAHVSDPGCNCATPVNPNTDMIQEFKVLTSNFGADNAKGPIVINSVAKAGGHDFHGLASMDIRHYKMNSNSWVNNYTGTAKPQNKFLYPQFQIGGPVLIPGTDFNKNRDKLYFFSAFEYYFQTLDTGLLGATVPTANMRNGNFSAAELANLGTVTASGGSPSQMNDCLTVNPIPSTKDSKGNFICDGTFAGFALTHGGVAPFPGGMIPASSIDQSGQGMINLFPGANVNPNSNGGYNYVKDEVFDQNSWQWMSRVDYSISDNTKLYVRYNLQKETQKFPVGLWWRNAVQVPYPTPILGKNVSDSVSASLTHVFSPTMSNEFVFGYTYIDFPNVFQDPKKVSRSALGIPFAGIFKNGVDQIPTLTGWGGEFASIINPSGFQIGGSQGLFAKKDLPSISDNLSKVWGTHTAKFGVYYEFVINDQPSSNAANGQLQEATWASATGNPYADLLTGHAGQYAETNKDVLHNEGYNTMEFFAMDSWKATRRLTLDYGLRVSHLGAWYDRQGNGFAVFNPALYVPGSAESSGTGFDWHSKDSKVPLSGFPNRALFYAPRFGAAFDVFGTGRTVLRGGWGQYYYHNAQFTQGLDQPLGVETPNLCCNLTFAAVEATVPGTQAFSSAGVDPKDDHSPLTTSYSVTVSQRLPFTSLLEVSYVGNKSKYQLNQSGVGTNVNVVPAGTLFNKVDSKGKPIDPSSFGSNEYQFAPFPIYQALNLANHNTYSNYNGLQVSWVRQKGRYDFTLNYTYSKALGLVGQDQLNLSQDYGAEPFDRRHIFNAAYSIELGGPIHNNKLLGGFVNGWQLSGITQFQSGVNLTANSNGENFNAGGNISGKLQTSTGFNITNQSINGTDQIPLQPILTCNPRSGLGQNQYINGNCFSIPTVPGSNGGIVLPEIFGPSFFNSDLALFKNFQISESRKLQLRFSAYNFMNHPIWTFTSGGVGSSAVNLNFDSTGAQTNTGFGVAPIKQGNRVIQISAKFYF